VLGGEAAQAARRKMDVQTTAMRRTIACWASNQFDSVNAVLIAPDVDTGPGLAQRQDEPDVGRRRHSARVDAVFLAAASDSPELPESSRTRHSRSARGSPPSSWRNRHDVSADSPGGGGIEGADVPERHRVPAAAVLPAATGGRSLPAGGDRRRALRTSTIRPGFRPRARRRIPGRGRSHSDLYRRTLRRSHAAGRWRESAPDSLS